MICCCASSLFSPLSLSSVLPRCVSAMFLSLFVRSYLSSVLLICSPVLHLLYDIVSLLCCCCASLLRVLCVLSSLLNCSVCVLIVACVPEFLFVLLLWHWSYVCF